MAYSEFNCPHCGNKNRETCNKWMYGSPIRICKSCGKKYVDKRYREVAIQGFDKRSVNELFYLKGALFFLALMIICLAVLWSTANFLGFYSLKGVFCAVGCAIGCVGCGVMYLRIKLGIETKDNDKLLKESEERLKDKAYVQELIDAGYDIPEKYL